jgi:hypothetical protein
VTYTEAKKMRLQIEKDVTLLRNRVRMLQAEEQRALKKISETKKKTQQIMALKSYNDQTFHLKMQERRRHESHLQLAQQASYQKRLKQTQDLRYKQAMVQEQKYSEAQNVRRIISE